MTEADIELVEEDFGPALEIESITKMTGMQKAFRENFQKIHNYINEREVKCKTAPYARYIDIDWEYQIRAGFFDHLRDVFKKEWHFFCGMNLVSPLEGVDSIRVHQFTRAKYIKAVHYGPYQNVGKLYSKMYLWAKENGYKCHPESFEFYTNDPREISKKELETIVYIPVTL